GGKDVSKYLAQTGASLTRSLLPLGSLVNEVAKMYDPTANDTTKGDAMEQFLAKVKDGIPGVANTLPSKMVEGNEIENPSPFAKFFGAASKEQGAGVQKSADIKAEVAGVSKTLSEYGAFGDSIRTILDDDNKTLFDKAKSGKEINKD